MVKFLVFKAIHNGPFVCNPSEVENVTFFSLEKIRHRIIKGDQFMPELLFLLKKHFEISDK